MTNFRFWNNLIGWFTFMIATIVYFMTMEPSSSLWDCGEFITTSYKLQIGHPPGAPLFMILARIATIFAPSSHYVPHMVNGVSCISSGLCVLFLFWSISYLARKLILKPDEEITPQKGWLILSAGFVGALTYAFTDTFWFSAVEGEVYAMSSMFTALVVWLMLRWDDEADKPRSLRWIILIAYLMGLSIGVHILNLLTIPALVFIYYFRRQERITLRGVVVATLFSGVILLFVNVVVLSYAIFFGAIVDLFFVNTLSLPVNSGMVAYLLLLIIGLGYASYRAYLKGHVRLNVILLSTTMLFVGYSSYAMVTIRAAANPPINCSNPSNPHALHSFLNRDQYGDKPLLWGAYYSAPFDGYSTRSFYSLDEDGRYIKRSSIDGYTHASEHMRFFPRMWDSQRAEGDYKPWAAYRTKEQGVEFGHEKRYKDQIIIEPTFGENLYFFFNYQLRHMFWRYFMWNFVGRQSDIQPSGVTLTDGNWLSGVDFIDKVYLGTQSNLPREVESNRGRNRYYFLPFILGFIGLLFQLYRDPKNFSIVMWLFIMMGIALVVYFNTSPSEPRERDYVYAGAFYSFSIWVGLGVVAIYNLLKGVTKGDGLKRVVATAIISLCVPAILLAENWDDHDRSHRTFARDVGWNYLQSTLPNSIILNYGDNDTFPLWFNQEVDGVRSDVRIMNSAYLNEAWYIDQMKRKTYESDPVPFSLPASKYSYTNDYLPVNGDAGQVVTIGDVVDFVRNDDPRTKVMLRDGSRSDYILSNRIAIPVNKQNAVESGIVKREDAHLILDTLLITLNRGSIDKSQLMILDLLANFDWERPIYFTQTNIPQALGLLDFLQFDGYGYRLVPISTPYTNLRRVGRIDCDYAASLLLNTFRYGNLDDKRVYVDNFIQYSISASKSREAFARVADEYILRGDNKKGVQLLDAGLKFFPISQIRFTSANTLPLIRSYYRAGAMVKGDALAKIFAENAMEYVEYYQQFDGDKRAQVDPLIKSKLSDLEQLYHIAAAANRVDLIDWLNSLKA